MPRYVQPTDPAPAWAARMSSVLGMNPLRLEILRHLAHTPEGATSGEIGRAIGAGYKTIAWHLRQLEDLDAVTSNAGESRQGQRVVFRFKAETFDAAITGISRYVKEN